VFNCVHGSTCCHQPSSMIEINKNNRWIRRVSQRRDVPESRVWHPSFELWASTFDACFFSFWVWFGSCYNQIDSLSPNASISSTPNPTYRFSILSSPSASIMILRSTRFGWGRSILQLTQFVVEKGGIKEGHWLCNSPVLQMPCSLFQCWLRFHCEFPDHLG
jgi:hypothetical protein